MAGSIFLIRHGHTIATEKALVCGSWNVGLSEKGKQQILDLFNKLFKIEISVCYTSPMKRCLETANLLRGIYKEEPIIVPEFREMDYGEWEKKPQKKIPLEYLDLWEQWILHPDEVSPPGGGNW